MTKYEAPEKNAFSETKTPQLGDLKYSRNPRRAPLYRGIFGIFIDGEIGARVGVAEGEELGSNLLRVAQSSLWATGGPLGVRSVRPYCPTTPVRPGDGRNGSHSRQSLAAIRPVHPGTTSGALAKPIPSPLINRIGEPGSELGAGITRIRLPDKSRQLEHPSPQILYLSSQKQILPIRHRQDGI